MKQLGALLIITTFAWPYFAQAKTVNFKMTVLDYEANPIKKHRCKHSDIVKKRPAKNPVDEPVATVVLTEKTALEPEAFPLCERVFTNLTQLDQQKIRDDVASILEEMPCAPGKDLVVEFGAKRNPDASKEYPGIAHNYIVNKINFEGCMDDMPALCSFPSAHTSWDSLSVIVDYEKMMVAFKRCKEALIKKVDDEGLLEKWQAANDPNATKGSKAAEHKKKSFISEK